MPTPFPGMDPYLESPSDLWRDVHNALIADLRRRLATQLRPRYYAAIEVRSYLADGLEIMLAGQPDWGIVRTRQPVPSAPHAVIATMAIQVASAAATATTVVLPMAEEVHESYLEVRLAKTDDLITSIELLSPTNKRPGFGRTLYEEKRRNLLTTLTNLVEIDFLRGGQLMAMQYHGSPFHYSILVSRAAGRRPFADLLPFTVRQSIPVFALPLDTGDAEPQVDLGQLLHELYDSAGYDLRIDYGRPPNPPLAEEDAAWAAELLRVAGAR